MKRFFFAMLSLALATPAFAQEAGLLAAPAGDDLVVARFSAAAAPSLSGERQAVRFAWALSPTAALERPEPFVRESREFWTRVPGAELARGVAIETTTPGAVVRLSPTEARNAAALSAEDVEVVGKGRRARGLQAIERAADAQQLRQAGADAPEGTLAFRLRPEVGAGRVTLRVARASGAYLVHVYEPDSPVALSLSSERDNAVAGGRVAIATRLAEGGKTLVGAKVGGLLTAPDGRSVTLDFVPTRDGRLIAQATLPADAAAQPGLWEVHAFASAVRGGQRIVRDAKTAIAVAAPTARLAGDYRVSQDDGVAFDVGVEAATEGRYEARGVLYATGPDGVLRPVAAAHGADWLAPGQQHLGLRFGSDLLPAGYGAPFALRELSLHDQSRLSLLETRTEAAVIPSR